MALGWLTSWWGSLGRRIGGIQRRIRQRIQRRRQAWLIRQSPRSIERWLTWRWCIRSLFSANERWAGLTRYEMGRELGLLTPADKWRAITSGQLAVWLDRRLYWGRLARPNESWPDLLNVAQTLVGHIKALWAKHPEQAVILSPFHYVCPFAYAYIMDEVRKALGMATITGVSGVYAAGYESILPHLKPIFTRDHDGQRSNLGIQVIQALRQDRIFVVFADATPYSMHNFPMDTTDVTILGRPGRIHSGVLRIGARMHTLLLPFYLRLERGRFSANILDVVELAAPDAAQQLADRISQSLKDNYAQWLMAGHPAMYGFASIK